MALVPVVVKKPIKAHTRNKFTVPEDCAKSVYAGQPGCFTIGEDVSPGTEIVVDLNNRTISDECTGLTSIVVFKAYKVDKTPAHPPLRVWPACAFGQCTCCTAPEEQPRNTQ